MRPRVILHNVASVDGRIDRLTPDLELYYRLAGRFQEDATLVGANTLLKGMPELGEPGEGEGADGTSPAAAGRSQKPLLVVPDSRGRIRRWPLLTKAPYWRGVLVLVSRTTPAGYREQLSAQQVEWLVVGEERVDLKGALEELGSRYGIGVVRVDSGGTLNGQLFRSGLVDELSLVIDPCLVGGEPTSIVQGPLGVAENSTRLELFHLERVAEHTVWLRYRVL